MKKLVGVLAISFICCSAFAQDSSMKAMNMHDTSMSNMNMKKTCVVNQDGKMMVMKNGKMTMMSKSMMLTNGSTVMADGTIKMSDGTTKMLKEGEYVDMDGKMGMMKNNMKKSGM